MQSGFKGLSVLRRDHLSLGDLGPKKNPSRNPAIGARVLGVAIA